MKRRTVDNTPLMEIISPDWLRKEGYRYAWLQCVSSVSLGGIEEVSGLEAEDILEARFFNEEKELRLFRYEDELRAVETVQDNDDLLLKKIRDQGECVNFTCSGNGHLYIEETQILRERFAAAYKKKKLKLRSFLDFDEDGQVFVLCSVFAADGSEPVNEADSSSLVDEAAISELVNKAEVFGKGGSDA